MDPAPSRRAWLLAAVAPLSALLLVRPWVRAPFPVWDYPEVLPILAKAPGIWNGAMAIAEWNRPDGRANYLSYLQFSLTWGIVGGDSVGWQIARALIMVTAAILLVLVARRLGATPLAAAVAAMVFTVAVPSTEGWLLLAGEQLGTTLLLLATLAAAGYTVTPRWRVRAVIIAMLAAAVMLSKEVLGLCLPPIVLLALCWDPETGFRRPVPGPRERWLVLLLLIVLVAEAWSVLSAVRGGVPGNYATAFGRTGLEPAKVTTLFQAMILPARFSSAGANTLLYPANLAIVLLLLLGLARGSNASRQRGWWWWVVGLLAYPVIGALAYGLWPRYTAYYGIPFFAASAGLIALAGSAIQRERRGGAAIVAALGAIAVVFTGLVSARTIDQKHATADLTRSISRTFASVPRLDTLFIVTPPQGGRRWPITARELRNYARFTAVPDSAVPVMLDTPCDDVVARLRDPLGRNAVLNDQNPCGRLPVRTLTWVADVSYRDWTTMALIADTMRVDIFAPSWAPAIRRP